LSLSSLLLLLLTSFFYLIIFVVVTVVVVVVVVLLLMSSSGPLNLTISFLFVLISKETALMHARFYLRATNYTMVEPLFEIGILQFLLTSCVRETKKNSKVDYCKHK